MEEKNEIIYKVMMKLKRELEIIMEYKPSVDELYEFIKSFIKRHRNI